MDATSCTTLFYGLTVRASDLLAAARAYSQITPAFRAIQLIQLRRRRGTLSIVPGSLCSVAWVLDEVWGLVREAMMALAVRDARLAILAEVGCEECVFETARSMLEVAADLREDEEEFDEDGKPSDQLRSEFEEGVERDRRAYQAAHVWDNHWPAYVQEDECQHYRGDSDCGSDDEFEHTLSSAGLCQESLASLLRSYGLHLPSPLRPQVSLIRSTTSIALLRPALSAPILSCEISSGYAATRDEYESEQEVARVDPAFLCVPADADKRLERFVWDWVVGVVPAPVNWGGRMWQGGVGERGASEEEKAAARRPGFFLAGSVALEGNWCGIARRIDKACDTHSALAMSAYSFTSLFYGLTVDSFELVAAARAYSDLEPAYRATELVSLRQRQATLLKTDGSPGALSLVPEEVWSMIRGWMVGPAVLEARVGMMKAAECSGCHQSAVNRNIIRALSDIAPERLTEELLRQEAMEDEEVGVMIAGAEFAEEQARTRYRVDHAWDSDWLDHCEPAHWEPDHVDFLCDSPPGLLDDELSSKALAALLARYGLSCPRPTRTLSAHFSALAGLAPATPLALRRPSAHTPSLRSAASAEHTHHRNAGLDSRATSYVPIHTDALTPPEDADARFGRFMRDWAVGAAPGLGGAEEGEDVDGARARFFMLSSLEIKGEEYGCCRCCYY